MSAPATNRPSSQRAYAAAEPVRLAVALELFGAEVRVVADALEQPPPERAARPAQPAPPQVQDEQANLSTSACTSSSRSDTGRPSAARVAR